MAQEISRQSLTFRDARGHTGKTSVYIAFDRTVANSIATADSLAEAFQANVAALTNGALVNVIGQAGKVLAPNQYGASAQYATAEDKARIRLLSADVTIHSINVPAPLLSVFEADQETVKGTAIATLVANLTAAPVNSAFFCTKAGSAFTASLGGQLVRKKFQRKLTIYDKSANLDEPEE